MLAYGARIGTSDRGCNPLRKIHFFAYVRQDATVLSGELANEENQGGVRRYWIFPQKKSPAAAPIFSADHRALKTLYYSSFSTGTPSSAFIRSFLKKFFQRASTPISIILSTSPQGLYPLASSFSFI